MQSPPRFFFRWILKAAARYHAGLRKGGDSLTWTPQTKAYRT